MSEIKKYNGRYWIFASCVYYPAGGAKDFYQSANTLEECKEILTTLSDEVNEKCEDVWYHILDTNFPDKGVFRLREAEEELKWAFSGSRY